MAHLGGRNVGLDGVLDQQANYERSGFRFAHHHVRYRGTGGGAADPGVVDLSAVPFDDLLAYDATGFPAPRPRFLRGWVARPERGRRRLPSAKRAVVGYGVIRPSVEGYKIGPLFADDPGGRRRPLPKHF